MSLGLLTWWERDGRRHLVLVVFALALAALVLRAVYLQVVEREFLQGEGDARQQRVVAIPAHRGVIEDRNGEVLALSTPVDSVWANPQVLPSERATRVRLAEALEIAPEELLNRLASRAEREFVYLRRHLTPDHAAEVMGLGIPGIALQREYRRYYPLGEVAGHVLGFTDIDDRGQEGIELAYDDWLAGTPGAKRVLRDRFGRVIEDIERLRPVQPGRSLRLSLDRRLQYLAYRELKAAVTAHGARSGSLVLLDAASGEILAMVNQPTFNPNNRAERRGGRFRNRAVTDVFEPGSSIKPFTVAAALQSGRFAPGSSVDTAPGRLRVAGHSITDVRDFGRIDLQTLLVKSSNVGAVKLALELEPDVLWGLYGRLGFGYPTGSGFPGEAAGVLSDQSRRRPLERATLAFGYGLSVTPLQLAGAFSVLASDGFARAPSFLALDEAPLAQPVLDPQAARAVRGMLEGVVEPGGTGTRAAVPGYRIAGKTGTVRKSTAQGYSEERYVAVFAGMAPASAPRLVAVVVIDEPAAGAYYGGQVAAPVFGRVMSGALRLLDIAPDASGDDAPALQAEGPDAEAPA